MLQHHWQLECVIQRKQITETYTLYTRQIICANKTLLRSPTVNTESSWSSSLSASKWTWWTSQVNSGRHVTSCHVLTLSCTAPGMDDQRDVMRASAKKKEGQRHALPPQIFNGEKYCGVSLLTVSLLFFDTFCPGLWWLRCCQWGWWIRGVSWNPKENTQGMNRIEKKNFSKAQTRNSFSQIKVKIHFKEGSHSNQLLIDERKMTSLLCLDLVSV